MPVSRLGRLRAGYALLLLCACGARTSLRLGPAHPPKPECDVDADCPGHADGCRPVVCVDSAKYKDKLPPVPDGELLPPRVCAVLAPKDCDTHDECFLDGCDAATGMCTHDHVTPDLDHDCHFAPKPGHKAGDAGSCGDDCDDSDPTVHPGLDCNGAKATQVCGKDNTCSGVVAVGNYLPLDAEPLRVSGDIAPSGPGGIAFDGDSYLGIYWGTHDGTNVYETRLDAAGNKVPPIEQRVTLENADGGGGPIVWVGDRYGTVWQDRRSGDYEIYFTLLGPTGQKAIADVRVTNAPGFSINPSLAWNQSEFVLAWQDDRDGNFDVWLQRVALDGTPQGDNVNVTGPGVSAPDHESPVLASGIKTLGMVYAMGAVGSQHVEFRSVDQTTLAPHAGPAILSPADVDAVLPQIVWSKDRYVVTWFQRSGGAHAVFATSVDDNGMVLTPPTQITFPPVGRHSRYPDLLALADKVLFVYADDRDGNQGYELYSRLVATATLLPIGPEERLTFSPFDSIYPYPTLGAKGEVGVLYRDDVTGAQNVFFRRLGCVIQ